MSKSNQPGELLPKDMRSPNHTRVDNAYFERGYICALGSDAFAIYACLCRSWSAKTGKTRISTKRLSEITGISTRHVLRVLDRLSSFQVIHYIPTRGRGKCNEYTILDPSCWLPVNSDTQSHFKQSKKRVNDALKHDTQSHFDTLKCDIGDKKNVTGSHPFKRSTDQGGGGGGLLTDDATSKIAQDGKTESTNIINFATAKKPPQPPFLKILSPSEEAERKNLLQQQARQLLGG
jgi:hypothetical protein